MEKLIEQYLHLNDEELGALVKMIYEYKKKRKTNCKNKQLKVMFYTETKKELDKILKERERKKNK